MLSYTSLYSLLAEIASGLAQGLSSFLASWSRSPRARVRQAGPAWPHADTTVAIWLKRRKRSAYTPTLSW